MSKRQNQNSLINGWIFLDKPIGVTSNKILQKVRKLFLNCKAGYVGTLDPMASGFLPIALGKATKMIKYLNESNKEYLFTVEWGVKTSTGDLEGELLEKKKIFPNKEDIEKKVNSFLGETYQLPPNFSAIKVNGKRAYKLARLGESFELPKRKINVIDFKVLKVLSERKTEFLLKCSSGTYVRSLIENLAESLGTVSHLSSLRRVGFGNLDKKLISLDSLISLMHIDKLIGVLNPVDYIFKGKKVISLKNNEAKSLLDGKHIDISEDINSKYKIDSHNFTLAKYKDKLIVIGNINNGCFFPKNVMNLNGQKN